MRDFQKLTIWLKAHTLTIKIYKHTVYFPKEELYCLTSQIRRSAASISTNIAEGCGRNSDPDFKRFLSIAAGSTSELEYQVILSKDLGYFNESDYKELTQNISEIRKMLYSFMKILSS